MRDRLQEFGDAHVAAVTFAPPEDLPPHRAHLELPFPMLADPERLVYRQFELGRGGLRQIWSPGTMRALRPAPAAGAAAPPTHPGHPPTRWRLRHRRRGTVGGRHSDRHHPTIAPPSQHWSRPLPPLADRACTAPAATARRATIAAGAPVSARLRP